MATKMRFDEQLKRFRTLMGAGVVILASVQAWGLPYDPIASETGREERRPIDLVICLDTSGSMQGLIDSARARLWDIVSSLAKARPTPILRVGLLTYGSPSRSTATAGWVARHSDLTTDLDSVYARLMSFGTEGGDEFVGWVLHDAVEHMNWSRNPRALRIIFVAGNESADQASEVFNFRQIGPMAKSRGILINALFAGDHQQGIREFWHDVAACGGGMYSAIDMSCGTIQLTTPHDQVLLELNMKLNATYVPFGVRGRVGAANQREQDENAERLGVASAASRVEAKGTALYENAGWDLVDAVAQNRVDLDAFAEAELPSDMRALSKEDQRRFIEQKKSERAEIQQEIAKVSEARQQFLKDARAQAMPGKTALDDAMLEALRKQAAAQGFQFKN